MIKFGTARARLLAQAIETGFARSGNHEITVTDTKIVTFFYRGTPITQWNMDIDKITQDALGYAQYPSTRANQRKNEQAIAEYRSAAKSEIDVARLKIANLKRAAAAKSAQQMAEIAARCIAAEEKSAELTEKPKQILKGGHIQCTDAIFYCKDPSQSALPKVSFINSETREVILVLEPLPDGLIDTRDEAERRRLPMRMRSEQK